MGYDAGASTSERYNHVSSSGRFVSLLLLTLLSVAIPLRAQSPAKPASPKVPRGTVSGRVTIKDKPAPGVVVGLRKSLVSGPFLESFQKGTTDQEGNYRIANVAPGSYEVVPSAPAYVVADANFGRGKNVVVGEDEEVEDINFSLVRGGVVTGKVTDADGRPVISQQVYLYRTTDFSQQQREPMRQIFPATNVQTDDRGIYRFFGLPAGQYKVAAGRGEGALAGTFSTGRLIYKQVFHPDTPDQTKATAVDVREGSEAANIDIALGRAMQTFSASGRIIYKDTQLPAPNFRFGFRRFSGERMEAVESMGVSNAQGDFVVDGLAPGRYGFFLYPNQNPELYAEAVMFDVVDQDVSMITVKLARGSTASGVIVFEHEDKKAFAKLLQFHLRGQLSTPSGVSVMMQSATTPISPDGSFRLTGLSAGRLHFWLFEPTGFSPPKGFLVSRIEHNGVVVPHVDVQDGDQLIGLRVFISYGSASVRGVVNYDRGLLPQGARLFANLMKLGPPMRTIASTAVDARGHFLMEGVPAGVYELMVSVTAAPGLRAVPTRQQITVQDGVVSDVSVTLDLPQPKP